MPGSENGGLHLQIMVDEMRESEYIEMLLQKRIEINDTHIQALKSHRDSIPMDRMDMGDMAAVAEYSRSLNSEIEGLTEKMGKMKVKMEKLKYGEIWTRFREIIGRMEVAEQRHDKAHLDAKENLDPGVFWSNIVLVNSWLDLQLPPQDIEYRRAVSEVNRVREEAFNYYVANQQILAEEHQERMVMLRSMAPGSTQISPKRSDTKSSLPGYEQDMPSPPFSPTLSELDFSGLSIRGPFAPVPYINHLDGHSHGTPVYGTALDSKSGTLIRQITEHSYDYTSSPHPIFVLPNSGGAGVSYCLRRAFYIERKWEAYHRALEEVNQPSDESHPVDKGWLLGLLLVNLPHPVLWISDKNIDHFKGGVPSDSIKYLLQRHSLPQNHSHEYHFLKNLWRHTDDENIRDGAVAITQRLHTEKILSDIRCKWNMDLDKTVPAYHRRRSSDEASRMSKLIPGRKGRNSHGAKDSIP